MKNLIQLYYYFNAYLRKVLNTLQPVVLLGARFYIAWVFFASGLTKIKDWDTTLFLFEEEYSVPLLSPELAAYFGTGGELILPVLLVLGLLSPISTIGLSVLNVIAVLSLEEIAPAAFTLHVLWGLLLATVLLWGPGRLSVDSLIESKIVNRNEKGAARFLSKTLWLMRKYPPT